MVLKTSLWTGVIYGVFQFVYELLTCQRMTPLQAMMASSSSYAVLSTPQPSPPLSPKVEHQPKSPPMASVPLLVPESEVPSWNWKKKKRLLNDQFVQQQIRSLNTFLLMLLDLFPRRIFLIQKFLLCSELLRMLTTLVFWTFPVTWPRINTYRCRKTFMK